MLGMYVHTHWSYRHPYAARTWTVADWAGYLRALRALGYDLVMFWPLTDAMPAEPNSSDLAFLDRINRAIDVAHAELGMKFYVTAGANVIGNERSAEFSFEERPYFVCEWKVNPKDRTEVDRFLAGRRRQFARLASADALVVIDSDPGGYVGSTDEDFVRLARAQTAIMRETNPRLEFIYWMWCGWEAYNRFWEEANKPEEERRKVEWGGYDRILELIGRSIPEPWSVFVSWPQHMQATMRPDLLARRCFNPYGLIEGEPTFPLTNVTPRPIREGLAEYTAARSDFPRGAIANCQTHCLQLPNTYYFAYFAQGGTASSLDLPGFAGRILPGCGDDVALAWEAIEAGDADLQRTAAEALRRRVGRPHPAGPLNGFLFGDPDRFIVDLVWNLEVRAAMTEFGVSFDAAPSDTRQSAVRSLLACLQPYQARLGFEDACYGPFTDTINRRVSQLGDERIRAAERDFGEWRFLPRRHGCLRRLLDALGKYAG